MNYLSLAGPHIFCVSLFFYVGISVVQCSCPKIQCNNTSSNQGLLFNKGLCWCDTTCPYYGDCCADAPSAKNYSFPPPFYLPGCVNHRTQSFTIYIIDSCPPSYTNETIRDKCESSREFQVQTRNPIDKLPVTNPTTRITYGNQFCARCHNVSTYIFWRMKYFCRVLMGMIDNERDNELIDNIFVDMPSLLSDLKFNDTLEKWQLFYEGTVENCTIIPFGLPYRASTNLRQCQPNVISACPVNVTEQNDKCPGFLSLVSADDNIYRNEYCAACNGVDTEKLKCIDHYTGGVTANRSTRMRTPPRTTFTQVTDLSSTSSSSSSSSSLSSTTTTTTKTTETTTTPTSSTNPMTIPYLVTTTNKRRAYLYIQMGIKCSEILTMFNITMVEAETVFYKTINRTYIRQRTLLPGFHIRRCEISRPASARVEDEPIPDEEQDGIVTGDFEYLSEELASLCILLFADVILVLFLFKHLRAKTKTVIQKALAGFSISLCLANIGLGLDIQMIQYCLASHIFTCFGFLSTLLWMSSIAFEVICNVWNAVHNIPISEDEKTSRFIVYACVCWAGAGIGTVLMLNVRRTLKFADCSFLFEHRLFHFFTFPMVVSVSMNLAFYTCSVFIICAQSPKERIFSKLRAIDFGLQACFTSLSTSFWIVTYFTGILNSVNLWYLLHVVDCILAFFIYMYLPMQKKLNTMYVCKGNTCD